MHLYRVSTTDGLMASVFARDFDEATSLFGVWHLINHGGSGEFKLTQVDPSNAGEDEAAIRDALELGLVGIGSRHPQHGWQIFPPDHLFGEAER